MTNRVRESRALRRFALALSVFAALIAVVALGTSRVARAQTHEAPSRQVDETDASDVDAELERRRALVEAVLRNQELKAEYERKKAEFERLKEKGDELQAELEKLEAEKKARQEEYARRHIEKFGMWTNLGLLVLAVALAALGSLWGKKTGARS